MNYFANILTVKREFIIVLIVSLSLALPGSAVPEREGRRSVCEVIKEFIGKGVDEKGITRTSIEMGHGVCLVVSCAVSAGGDLEKIVEGAMLAGCTSDVISRCAMSGGANPQLLAEALGVETMAAVALLPEDDTMAGSFNKIFDIFESPYEPVSRSSF
jgi:hypothetical protein